MPFPKNESESPVQADARKNALRSLGLINPIIAALDVDSIQDCLRIADSLKGKIGAFKVGPRLVVRYGADLIQKLSKSAPVFVDNKYLDIPSTMESAIRATFEAGATLATVHAGCGPEALRRLAKIESELNAIRPFQILSVTILTSFSPETLPPNLSSIAIAEQVEMLARSVIECGMAGLVCSPHEATLLRSKFPTSFLVTPGVRMQGDAVDDQKRVDQKRDDQKRVDTPYDALRKGASALVVGRPIIEAKDPLAALEKILSSIQEA